MKYCTKCGSPMADDDIYCAKCGAASAPSQPSVPQASAPRPMPSIPAAPTGPAQSGKGFGAKWKQMKPKQKGLLCGIAATVVAAVVLVIALGGSNDSYQPSSSGYSPSAGAASSGSASSGSSADITKMQVATALRDEIGSKYDTADPDSCRYDINKKEEQGNYTYVYGSVTLYDKYGKLTTGWRDDSGTPYRSYTVKINNSTGDVVSCEIK